MTNLLESFRDHFNEVVESVQRYAIFVRGREFQEASIKTLNKLLKECIDLKEQEISNKSEESANAFLAFELMIKALTEEFRFLLALKADDVDKAWDHLINAESSAAAAMSSHAIASHLDRYINKLHTFERLLFPQPIFFSSGFIVKKLECSICGVEYGECDHIKGRPYMGQLCAEVVKEAELREVSIVSDPADKHCRALSFTEDGITKSTFTHRVIQKMDDQQLASPPPLIS